MTHLCSLSKLIPHTGGTDRWAAIIVVVAIALFAWECRWHSQIARWLSIQLHKLHMLVCLGQPSTMASVALYCQGRFALFQGRHQNRLACIDVIPALANDVGILQQGVAHTKQDIADIKKDVTDIKECLQLALALRFKQVFMVSYSASLLTTGMAPAVDICLERHHRI